MKKRQLLLFALLYCFGAMAQDISISPNGQYAVMKLDQSEYEDWTINCNFNPEKYTPIIYEKFKDDFDFVVYVLNELLENKKYSYDGRSYPVASNEEGIGTSIYSMSKRYGSDGKLSRILHMPYRYAIKNGPLVHEIAHRWANYAIPTIDFRGNDYAGHWGVTGGSTPGQLGGFLQSSLTKEGNRYTVAYCGPNANGGNVPYNQLELYLMGMIPVEEVEPFSVFRNVSDVECDYATYYAFTSTQEEIYTPQRLVEELGERKPDYKESQKDFKALFVVVTNEDLTAEEVKLYNDQISEFCANEKPEDGHNFYSATGGRGTFTTGDITQSLRKPNVGLTVTAPEASTAPYNLSSPLTIQWSSEITGKVSIELYKNGVWFKNIVQHVDASAEEYSWLPTLSDYQSQASYLVKIVSEEDNDIYSYGSEFNFYVHNYTVSGKVLDQNGAGIPNAVVTAGGSALQISTERTETDGFSQFINNLCSYNIIFTPTTKYLSSFSFKTTHHGNPTPMVILSIIDELETVIWEGEGEIDMTQDWTEIRFSQSIEVIPNKTYTFRLFKPDTNPEDDDYIRMVWLLNEYNFVHKVMGSDAPTTYCDADGNYSISLPQKWSSKLTAISESLIFEAIDITIGDQDLVDQNIKERNSSDNDEIDNNPSVNIWTYKKKIVVENYTGSLYIVDVLGRTVKSVNVDALHTEIEMPNIGLYQVIAGPKIEKVILR